MSFTFPTCGVRGVCGVRGAFGVRGVFGVRCVFDAREVFVLLLLAFSYWSVISLFIVCKFYGGIFLFSSFLFSMSPGLCLCGAGLEGFEAYFLNFTMLITLSVENR